MRKKDEWDFFVNPKTGKIEINGKCARCVRQCTQSFRAIIIECPRFEPIRGLEDKSDSAKKGR